MRQVYKSKWKGGNDCMNGIEKITQRIAADAEKESQAILTQAREQAAEITAGYQADADAQAAEVLEKGRQRAEERRARLISAAEMEGRQELLAVKQELLDRAYTLALDRLCALPEGDYINLLASLTAQAAVSGREQLILSRTDRARFGVKVAAKANDILAKEGRTAGLKLSQESRDFRGGLILSDGDVEVNCTFETLVRLARASTAGQVAGLLFA